MCNTIPPLNQNTIEIKKTFDFIILFTCFNTSLSLKGFLGGVKQGYYDSLSVGF